MEGVREGMREGFINVILQCIINTAFSHARESAVMVIGQSHVRS